MKTELIALSLLFLVTLSEANRSPRIVQGSSANQVTVVDQMQNTHPMFEAGPFVMAKGVDSADACAQACIRAPNCRSYYFGTDADCSATKRIGKRECSLFARPMARQAVNPLAINTLLFDPEANIAIAGNVNGDRTRSVYPSIGWYFADKLVLKSTNVGTSKGCEALCLKDKKCKSWMWNQDPTGIDCETFNLPITFPSNENEEWKVGRKLLRNGFGGVTGNVLRQSTNPTCSDTVWQSRLIDYKKCVLGIYQRNAVIEIGCEQPIRAVEKLFTDCGIKPDGSSILSGKVLTPNCFYSE